jgi:hypothetical protein
VQPLRFFHPPLAGREAGRAPPLSQIS